MTPRHTTPEELLLHPAHTWARVDGDGATLGITDHAQELLGEIVFWDPPQVGARVVAGEAYTELESTKATSDVIAPLSGEIVAVNDVAVRDPETINYSPYAEGWLVQIVVVDPSEIGSLLTAIDYDASNDK